MSTLLWLPAVPLNLLLVIRMLRDRRLHRFRCFYIYVGISIVGEPFLLFLLSHVSLTTYSRVYWAAETVTDSLTCGALYEVCAQAFGSVDGAQRFSKILRCFACLIALSDCVAYGIVGFSPLKRFVSPSATVSRGVLALMCLLTVLIICGIWYFGIQPGKNLKGMLLGFGSVMGGSMLIFSAMSIYGVLRPFWYFEYYGMLACQYAAIIIWLITMWNYHPDPVIDLEALRAACREPQCRARMMMGSAWAFLTGLVRT